MPKMRRCPYCWSAAVIKTGYRVIVVEKENMRVGVEILTESKIGIHLPIVDTVDQVRCATCNLFSYWDWDEASVV